MCAPVLHPSVYLEACRGAIQGHLPGLYGRERVQTCGQGLHMGGRNNGLQSAENM